MTFDGTQVGPDGKRYSLGHVPALTRSERLAREVRARGDAATGDVPTVQDDGTVEWAEPGGGSGVEVGSGTPRFNIAIPLEAITGRYTAVNSGGTVSLDANGLHVPCGPSASDYSAIILVDGTNSPLPATGNPEVIISGRINNNDVGDNAVGFAGFGTPGPLNDFTDNNLGFKFTTTGTTATVTAVTSDGTTATETALAGIDGAVAHTYRVVRSDSSVEFFVDGVSKATHTTHLPVATHPLFVGCSQVSGPNTPELQVWAITASTDA